MWRYHTIITPTRGICKHDSGGPKGEYAFNQPYPYWRFIIDLFPAAMFGFEKPS